MHISQKRSTPSCLWLMGQNPAHTKISRSSGSWQFWSFLQNLAAWVLIHKSLRLGHQARKGPLVIQAFAEKASSAPMSRTDIRLLGFSRKTPRMVFTKSLRWPPCTSWWADNGLEPQKFQLHGGLVMRVMVICMAMMSDGDDNYDHAHDYNYDYDYNILSPWQRLQLHIFEIMRLANKRGRSFPAYDSTNWCT